MVNAIFPKNVTKGLAGTKSKLESVTLRGFSGGWNMVDDDLSMQPRYCKVLNNFFRSPSGGQILRYGQNWFCDIASVHNSSIVDITYFNNRLVAVCVDGWIVSITDAGTCSIIWSPTIAAALPGAPGFWTGSVTTVTFVPFKNMLAIHNGKDKPVQISSLFAVSYLCDAGTGSNVNVPIGKYACTAANYHCVAGFTSAPTQIVISAQGTFGTFPLDPAPNDAISIDVGAYAPEGAAAIRGIAGYRSFLLVFLQEITLQVKLGVYDASTGLLHQPQFPDTFPKFGLLGSRCITSIENDIIFAGLQGLSSAKKNTYAVGQLDSTMVSSVIEPAYQKAMGHLTDTEKLQNTFSVYDRLAHNLLIFLPDATVFVYTSNEKLGYKAWSHFSEMNWTCGCTTILGRVFLCKGTRIFQHGNVTFGERYYADRMNDRDATWATGITYSTGMIVYDATSNLCYTCNVTHKSGPVSLVTDWTSRPELWTIYDGLPISFELEMPWFEGKDPMKVKKLRFVSITTRGTGKFTLEMYVDNLYKDYDENQVYQPVLSMNFVGNDAAGFGVDNDISPYGGGVRSRDTRLTAFPAKFKSAKFRIIGSSRKPLEFINFSFLFSRGRFFR